MTNIIRFAIPTDAPYTNEEAADLLDDFKIFIGRVDGDVDLDSASVSIIPEGEDETIPQKDEIIAEYLKGATIQISAQLISDEGVVNKKFDLES